MRGRGWGHATHSRRRRRGHWVRGVVVLLWVTVLATRSSCCKKKRPHRESYLQFPNLNYLALTVSITHPHTSKPDKETSYLPIQ